MKSRFVNHLFIDRLESRRMMAADWCHVAGDSNFDGVFDSGDFVQVFQSGKYETGQPASIEEGDWNGDGVFDSSDLVFAFQGGAFETPLTGCRFSEAVTFDRPSDGPFSSYYLELQPDGTGTIVPGSDIAYFITSYEIASSNDGTLSINIKTHVETEFSFTMDSLRATTLVDQWGNEWSLANDN